LGDFVYTWPIAAWFHQHTGRKVHWVLPEFFGPFKYIERLLRLQTFTQDVTLVSYRVANYSHGGQPYQFNPKDYGVEGEYFNLGFRGYPDRFIPHYLAQEHSFGVDESWELELGEETGALAEEAGWALRLSGFIQQSPEPLLNRAGGSGSMEPEAVRRFRSYVNRLPPYDETFRHIPAILSRESMLCTEHANYPLGVTRIDLSKDFLFNAQWMRASVERHCFFSSMAVILYFAKVPFHLGRQPGHPSESMYFPDDSRYTIERLPA
jgi:hypothetical protein